MLNKMIDLFTLFAKKIILTLIIIVNFSSLTFATEQIPDILIYNDVIYYISGTHDDEFPLYKLLKDELYTSKMEKDYYNQIKLSSSYSTGCYRGYQAVWELDKGIIYLKAVLDGSTKKPILDLKKIFGDKMVGERVRAFWINENLTISSKPLGFSSLEDEWKYVNLKVAYGRIKRK